MKYLYTMLCTMLLTGCAGYQFGDGVLIASEIAELHELNCKNHPNGKGCEVYNQDLECDIIQEDNEIRGEN